jgi:hypothetical protein
VDKWSVEQATDDWNQQEEPDAEPWEVEARHSALLAELLVTRYQPREAVDEPSEPDGSEATTHADDERHDDKSKSGHAQPSRRAVERSVQ